MEKETILNYVELETEMFINTTDDDNITNIVKHKSILNQFLLDLNIKNYLRKYKKKHNKLKNEFIKLKEEIININKKLNKLGKIKKNKLFELKNEFDSNKSLNFYLISKEDDINQDKGNNKSFFNKWFKKDMGGYITYFNKTNNMQIIEVSNLRNIYNIKNLESYAIHKYIGSYNRKPNFLIKYPIPISLEFINSKKIANNNHELVFDAESFYTYIEKIDTYKLTRPKSESGNSLFDFISSNIFIIIGVVALLVLLLTSQGRILLQEIFKAFSLKPK